MWLLFVLVLVTLVYSYRFQVLKWFLYKIVGVYCYYRSWEKPLSKVRVKKYKSGYIHEYKLRHDNFDHSIKIIHNTESHELCVNDTISKLGNKTCIVHCNLSTEDNKFIMDLTDVIREFFVHFDSNTDLAPFLEYIEAHYHYKLRDSCKIVLYKNDDSFSEVSMNLQSLKNKKFKDLVMN